VHDLPEPDRQRGHRDRGTALIMAIYGRYPFLQELPRRLRITAECPACQRSVLVVPEDWARRYGWRRTLEDLEPRLRCAVCGAQGEFRVVGRA